MTLLSVENMVSSNGTTVPNQFITTTPEGRYFQSYNTIIAFISTTGEVTINSEFTQSRTTNKYRNLFLGETTIDTKRKLASGEYKLADLNIKEIK